MILELGVIALGYVGIKLFKRYEKKHTPRPEQSHNKPVTTQIESSSLSENRSAKKTAIEKQTNHFLKWSVSTVILILLRGTNPILFAASIGSLLYINTPVLKQTYHSLVKEQKFGHAGLTTIMFTIGLFTGYHFALAVGGCFYFLGSKLMVKARGESEAFFHDIFENRPQFGWVIKDGVEIELPLKDIYKDDIVIVKTGEVVPVDGIIVEGQALIDQRALTGEFQPAEKTLGEQVFASTLVLAGRILIQVEKSGEETAIAEIAQILSRSFDHQSKIQLKGQEWADQSSVPFLLASGLAYFTLGPGGAIVALNSRPGNGIRFLGALSTLNHIKSASQHGLIIKDGRALENLKDIDAVIFDKTGTLTLEQPKIGRIFPYDADYKDSDILRYTAAVEGRLSHPIARAIVEKSRACGLTLPILDDSAYEVGYGLTAHIDRKLIHVGSVRFMEMVGVPLPKTAQCHLQQAQLQGNALVLIAIERQLIGGIEIEAMLRTETPLLLQKLRQRGVKHISIVSGDYEQPTKALADLLQMDSYFSQILPEKKASIVENFQRQGYKVCFIGDGVNDTIAMQQADVAISLTSASSIAIDVAHIVITQDSLAPISDIFDISRKLDRNLLYSLGFVSILPTFLNLSGLFFFNIGVLSSFVINNVSFLLGLGNVMWPLQSEAQDLDSQLEQGEMIYQEKRN